MKQSHKHKKRNRSDSSSSKSKSSFRSSFSSSRERKHKKQKNKHKKTKHYKNRSRSRQKTEKKQRNQKKQNEKNREQRQYQNRYQKIKVQEKQKQKGYVAKGNWNSQSQPQENKIKTPYKKQQINEFEQEKIQKQMPCFQPSGILLQYYNSRQGVSLRFHQPPQGRPPNQQWRIYVFKGEQVLKPIILTNSNYLIGKDERVVDILTQNPSISRQHCVIQFRLIQKRTNTGEFEQKVKPYIMDLQSTNGTFLNDQKIQTGRYYELLHRDREYVIVKWQEQQQNQQG